MFRMGGKEEERDLQESMEKVDHIEIDTKQGMPGLKPTCQSHVPITIEMEVGIAVTEVCKVACKGLGMVETRHLV